MVHVDVIKNLAEIAPGFERLRLQHDTLLSKFAFNFNWRRFNKDEETRQAAAAALPAGA